MYYSGKITDISKYLNLLKNIKGKIVACDLDNTLVNTNFELKKYGFDITHYPIEELDDKFWLSAFGNEIMYNAEPIKTILKCLFSMQEAGGEIIFCTQRSEALENLTYSWFRRNHLFTNMIRFVNTKKAVNADIFIEDNPKEIKELLSINKIVIVPTWEYNKDISHGSLIRLNINNNFDDYVKGVAV